MRAADYLAIHKPSYVSNYVPGQNRWADGGARSLQEGLSTGTGFTDFKFNDPYI